MDIPILIILSLVSVFQCAECSILKYLSFIPGFDKFTFYVMENDDGDLVPAIVKGTAPNMTVNLRENVRFYLYTRNRSDTSFQLYINDTRNLLESGFDTKNKTKIIIHGFANTIEGDIIQVIKNDYLEENWYNVIGVDWSDLSSPPYYNSAVNNIDSVGSYVAQMIDYLIRQNLLLESVHVIGHSLGAHVAGAAGSQITSGTLPRITGLDPAKPLFDINSPDKRLDPTDAKFVDCIHTCGGYLGFFEPICSVNFYPNCGTDPQPGCTWDIFGVCSHARSYYYYAESIKDKTTTPFIAIKCATIDDMDNTSCETGKNETALMGENTNSNSTGIYYLKTNSNSPFVANNPFANIGIIQKFLWFFLTY